MVVNEENLSLVCLFGCAGIHGAGFHSIVESVADCAQCFARAFPSAGVEPGQLVTLCGPRGKWKLLALLRLAADRGRINLIGWTDCLVEIIFWRRSLFMA